MIRVATPDDAAAIRDIYAPYVRDTVISFELDVPSVEDMRKRIEKTLAFYPWLVAERDGAVVGYAYASVHNERIAYQWSVNSSVYIDSNYRRNGIGRALYTRLFEILRAQGMINVYAGTTLPNEGSVGLHTAMGFQHVGTYRTVGYKFGAWHDVAWWHLPLCPPIESPQPPRAFASVL
jgi:L-amino acid N-acyltransferase YncA